MNHVDHLSDAALVAYLDGASGGADGELDPSHVECCEQCGERLMRLRTRSDRLADWFRLDDELALDSRSAEDEAPEPVRNAVSSLAAHRRARWALSRPTRIAAALVLLLGGLSMTPLRAVVMEWINAAIGGPASETGGSAEPAPSVFAFDVGGPTFEIRIDGAELTGRLVVTIDDVTRGLASVVGGDGTEEIVLRAGTARIDVRVGRSPDAEYRVVLPAEVSRVSVVLPGGTEVPVWRPDSESIPRSWSLLLGRR